MPRPKYSRAVREAAEKISPEDVADQPQIVALRKRADALDAKHRALVAQQAKVRKAAQTLEVRIEELKGEVASKRAALPSIALEVTAAGEAREVLQRMTWQIEAATDGLAQYRARRLTAMQTECEQVATSVTYAASAVEEAIEAARLQMAYDNN